MVTKCPDTSSTLHINNGNSDNTRLTNTMPVSGEDGFVYINEYFARCHGLTKFTSWDVGFRIDDGQCNISSSHILQMGDRTMQDPTKLTGILTTHGCEYSYYEAASFFTSRQRLCFPNINGAQLCENHVMPIKGINSSKIYRNVDCCIEEKRKLFPENNCSVDAELCPVFTYKDRVQSVYIENEVEPGTESPELVAIRYSVSILYWPAIENTCI